ncbi:MAG: hypothetical protein GKR94_01895 [Gammaproteobacteria bacterium]|nr:hypothetical protein [Gammaproteobacteria bacterium]
MNKATLAPTPGAKVIYLIKRKSSTSRSELVAHWYANHMPPVIAAQEKLKAREANHARRYIVSLFESGTTGEPLMFDGMAQLWWQQPVPKPDPPHGTAPADSFQEKAEPYMPWPTREYVVMDGALASDPLTLNAPYPSTRSGFFKVSFLVAAQPGTDYDAFFAHWLNKQAPNVRGEMEKAGGLRYVVNHSLAPQAEAFAGLAELYFPSATEWHGFRKSVQPDGMEQWMDAKRTLVFHGDTDMIGIP